MTREAEKLREKYHDISQEIEIVVGRRLRTLEGRQVYSHLTGQARELISRCILMGDYRSFIALVSELAILFKTIEQPKTAEALQYLVTELTARYKKIE